VTTYQVEVEIRPSEDGGYIAEAIGLQGCWVTADTIDEAIDDIREVIPMWIRTTRDRGWPLPEALHDAGENPTIRTVIPIAVARSTRISSVGFGVPVRRKPRKGRVTRSGFAPIVAYAP